MAEKVLPVINKQKCVLCGLCVDSCPEGVLALQASELVFANSQDCVYCATCEETCPEGAVRCEFEIRWAS
jgi:formate hydrogenlyase subunit 6/NADH:ubiquinone oxidoreductase subunit I